MQTDLGIVLRSVPYQERDRLVHILTENHGKIAGIAKGAIHSRRFGGSLDLFNCIHVKFVEKHGRELVRIEEATTKRDFPGIRETLERISAAGYFADLCLRLTEERHPIREVFVLLAHYFYLLEKSTVTLELVRSFEIKLLDRLGYSPTIQNCITCGEAILPYLKLDAHADFGISVERGGVLCPKCLPPTSARTLSRETVVWIQMVRNTPVQEIAGLNFTPQAVAQGADFLKDFLRYHCPGMDQYSLRSHDFLEQMLAQ